MKISKTKKRNDFIKLISDTLTDKEIFDTIDYNRKNEDAIKQFMYQPLVNSLKTLYEKNNNKDAKNKAKASIIWEANKQSTLHNMILFGTQHRPDMEVIYNGLKIAIEIKKGNNGSDIRQGIGQCITYSIKYDFVIFIMIDTTDDKKILNSVNAEKETFIINDLWKNYNIKFVIV
jgi:hypothetical protein